MIELSVKFMKRIYGTPDGDYSVFVAEAANFAESKKVSENDKGEFTIAGDFSLNDDEIGMVYTVTIQENFTARYPNSYNSVKLHYDFPKDAESQWDYLESSSIIPLRTFLEIQKTFKKTDKILDIIVDSPSELEKVKGIGEERANHYHSKLLENRDKALLFSEYGDIEGVSSHLINKLLNLKPRVEDTIKEIEADPFMLIEYAEIGFVVADRFREYYKYPINDRNRILHGVSYYLNQGFQSSGNTYDEILPASKEISGKLKVSYREVVTLLAEIQKDEKALTKYRLKIFGKNITTYSLFQSELIVYKRMNEMIKEKKLIANKQKWEKNKEEYLSKLPQALSKEQGEFLSAINEERVSVLLGPGGTGKSWVINIACDLIKASGKTFGLFAPTARAAHVMSEYVGVEAMTIHRGLMGHVLSNEIAPYDVLIVDEFSMVDSELASIVVQAMGLHTRLIIVGDDYQLQSVGPGNVLFDLVEYVQIPTTRLTKVFRQGENSRLLDYAQDLRDGTFKLPIGAPRLEEGDITFIHETDDTRKQAIAMKLYTDALSRVKNNYEDIMLLSPINKGPAGRGTLNKKVQEIVNPGAGSNDVVFGANSRDEDAKRYFRRGDYITVTSNQYEMISDTDEVTQLINGDLGEVSRTASGNLTFDVNKKSYTIDKSEINSLIDHAWTITIHKSQGGQASEVIIVLPESSYFMLSSNMLYTALTRAKVKCYLIGNFREINTSAKRQANYTRKTMIQLQKESELRAIKNKVDTVVIEEKAEVRVISKETKVTEITEEVEAAVSKLEEQWKSEAK